ncbi:MAG: hypothetical protein K6A43_01255 [Treponema sp.]|nr:hypothetical protein [Treponema sp.]
MIIPHTETELLLLKLQKELVENFYKNADDAYATTEKTGTRDSVNAFSSTEKKIICAVSPLWIPLPQEIEHFFPDFGVDLKEAAKKITHVQIGEPALCDEWIILEEKTEPNKKHPQHVQEGIFSKVKIEILGKEFTSKLELCRIIQKKSHAHASAPYTVPSPQAINQEQKKETSTTKAEISSNFISLINSGKSDILTKFPLELRIFRLGRQEMPAPYTKAISESVWRKIPTTSKKITS